MPSIPRYFADYIRQINLLKFMLIVLLMSILVIVNYTVGIEERIAALENRYLRFIGFFALFTFVVSLSYLILFLNNNSYPQQTAFYFLLIISTALFALKMSMQTVPHFFEKLLSFPSFTYWRLISHWPVKAILMLSCVALIWKYFRLDPPIGGLSKPYGGLKSYLIVLVISIPLLLLASSNEGFQQMYPRVKAIYMIENIEKNPWLYSILYEICYGIDFLTIELFFRGFMVLAFAQYVGKDAILPMAVFYCCIHFGKPLAECISSFFGGMLLGSIVLYTRSIWGGLVVHLGLAWGMELVGMLNR